MGQPAFLRDDFSVSPNTKHAQTDRDTPLFAKAEQLLYRMARLNQLLCPKANRRQSPRLGGLHGHMYPTQHVVHVAEHETRGLVFDRAESGHPHTKR